MSKWREVVRGALWGLLVACAIACSSGDADGAGAGAQDDAAMASGMDSPSAPNPNDASPRSDGPVPGDRAQPQSGSGGDEPAPTGDDGTGAPLPDAGTRDPGTMMDTPALRMECNGKPLPPRARSQQRRFAVGPEAAGLEPYWPTMGWRSEAPEKLGFDPAKLAAAVDFSAPGANSQAVLVVRHGYVAAEKYFGSFRASTKHESFSMAKSFSSALVGIAIGEGAIASTDYRICMAYPAQWDCADAGDLRSKITIEHAMNLSTGLEWSEDWRTGATGMNDAYSFNILGTALSREALVEPGTSQRYSTGDPALLTGPIQEATGMTALAYAKQKMFDVIGTPGITWNNDSAGRTTTYAGLQATAVDYAKFGYLYLNRGIWGDAQVVPAEWIDRTTIAQDPCNDWYQWLWHVNMPNRLGPQAQSCTSLFCPPTEYADLPGDGYFAEGINGQFIFIVPSADLVVVRLAQDGPGSENWDAFARGFMLAMLDAIVAP